MLTILYIHVQESTLMIKVLIVYEQHTHLLLCDFLICLWPKVGLDAF